MGETPRQTRICELGQAHYRREGKAEHVALNREAWEALSLAERAVRHLMSGYDCPEAGKLIAVSDAQRELKASVIRGTGWGYGSGPELVVTLILRGTPVRGCLVAEFGRRRAYLFGGRARLVACDWGAPYRPWAMRKRRWDAIVDLVRERGLLEEEDARLEHLAGPCLTEPCPCLAEPDGDL